MYRVGSEHAQYPIAKFRRDYDVIYKIPTPQNLAYLVDRYMGSLYYLTDDFKRLCNILIETAYVTMYDTFTEDIDEMIYDMLDTNCSSFIRKLYEDDIEWAIWGDFVNASVLELTSLLYTIPNITRAMSNGFSIASANKHDIIITTTYGDDTSWL